MGNDNSKEVSPAENTIVQLQKKLTKGQSHTLNLCIMGDKCTGKSSLFNMLQRKRFEESYSHTTQNQSAMIAWEFRLSEVKVAINIRDIVQPRIKKKTNELKTKDSGQDSSVSVITPDVTAIIFMIDPRKKYTLEYVERELQHIIHKPDILLVSNFTDLCSDTKKLPITKSIIQEFIQTSHHTIRHCEASMADRFGVKAIKTFVGVPFAKLEENFLLNQLERVKQDIMASYDEFDQLSEEQDYSFYKDWLAKAIQERLEQQKSGVKRPTTPQGQNSSPAPGSRKPRNVSGDTTPAVSSASATSKIKPGRNTSSTGNAPPAQKQEESGGFFSKIKSIVSGTEEKKPPPSIIKKTDPRKAIHDLKQVAAMSRTGKQVEASIDSFDPSALDGGNDYDSFFSDDEDGGDPIDTLDDSDDEDFNPLVQAAEDFNNDSVAYAKPAVTKKATPVVSPKKPKENKQRHVAPPIVVEDPFFSDDEGNPMVAPGDDPFSSDDEGPNPLVAAGNDPFSDDDEGPNPMVAAGADPFSSDDEGPNPLVAAGNDPFSDDDEGPNPMVADGADPFSSDDEGPNPLVAAGNDPFFDDEGPNPLVAAGNDPFSDDDEGPNPMVAAGADPFSSDDEGPNPLVAAGHDPFSDDEGPNPLVDMGNDPFSSDDDLN